MHSTSKARRAVQSPSPRRLDHGLPYGAAVNPQRWCRLGPRASGLGSRPSRPPCANLGRSPLSSPRPLSSGRTANRDAPAGADHQVLVALVVALVAREGVREDESVRWSFAFLDIRGGRRTLSSNQNGVEMAHRGNPGLVDERQSYRHDAAIRLRAGLAPVDVVELQAQGVVRPDRRMKAHLVVAHRGDDGMRFGKLVDQPLLQSEHEHARCGDAAEGGFAGLLVHMERHRIPAPGELDQFLAVDPQRWPAGALAGNHVFIEQHAKLSWGPRNRQSMTSPLCGVARSWKRPARFCCFSVRLLRCTLTGSKTSDRVVALESDVLDTLSSDQPTTMEEQHAIWHFHGPFPPACRPRPYLGHTARPRGRSAPRQARIRRSLDRRTPLGRHRDHSRPDDLHRICGTADPSYQTGHRRPFAAVSQPAARGRPRLLSRSAASRSLHARAGPGRAARRRCDARHLDRGATLRPRTRHRCLDAPSAQRRTDQRRDVPLQAGQREVAIRPLQRLRHRSGCHRVANRSARGRKARAWTAVDWRDHHRWL